MCLTTRDPEIKIATQDIIVYKELTVMKTHKERNWLDKLFGTKRYQTEHRSDRGYEYKIGKINPTVELLPRVMWSSDEGDISEVEQGYHSDIEQQEDSNAIFVIPKGTKYIEGWYNDDTDRPNIVSETIIFKQLLD